MTGKVILNPYSNRWNSQKRWPQAEAALKAAGVDFELEVSPEAGAPVALAEAAFRAGYSPIIAAGGDGTVGDVVHGMALAAGDDARLLGPLGILPLGTANDLAWKVGVPLDLEAAAQVIAAGQTRRMDIGKVNHRYFANNSAIGLESYIGVLQFDIKYISGILRYLVAAVKGIAHKPEWSGTVEWDGGSYQGPLSIVTVGNGSRSGGLFHMIPHADPFDGQLSSVYTHKKTRRAMIHALACIMKPGAGNYVEMGDVFPLNFTRMQIRLENPSPVHTDGEISFVSIQDLDYEVQPARLQILTQL